MKTYILRITIAAAACVLLTSCGSFSPGRVVGNFWNAINPWAHGTGQMIERHGHDWTDHHRNTRKAIEDY